MPIIYHGHTLTTKVTFQAVCEAINTYGFVTSEYPVHPPSPLPHPPSSTRACAPVSHTHRKARSTGSVDLSRVGLPRSHSALLLCRSSSRSKCTAARSSRRALPRRRSIQHGTRHVRASDNITPGRHMHVHCAVVGAPREHAVRDGGVGRAGPRSQPELQVRMAEIMLEAFKDEEGKSRLATHKDQCVCALIRYFRVTVALSHAAPNRRFAIGQQRAGQTSVSRIEAVGGSIEPGFFLTVALAFGSAERALRSCHTSVDCSAGAVRYVDFDSRYLPSPNELRGKILVRHCAAASCGNAIAATAQQRSGRVPLVRL